MLVLPKLGCLCQALETASMHGAVCLTLEPRFCRHVCIYIETIFVVLTPLAPHPVVSLALAKAHLHATGTQPLGE